MSNYFCFVASWDWRIIFIFAVMVLSGFLGGYINSCLDDGHQNKVSQHQYMIIGVGASLMVPLFLSTISSGLILEVSQGDNIKLLVLIGFCLVASISSKTFIKSMSDQVLKQVQTVGKQLGETGIEVKILQVKDAVDNKKYEQALTLVEAVLEENSRHAKAWAWRGYIQKKLAHYKEAIIAMQKANEFAEKPHAKWYYNLACYQCLDKQSVDDVLKALGKAHQLDTKLLSDNLKEDEDFALIKEDPKFIEFCKQIGV